jgi:hypothetical protein
MSRGEGAMIIRRFPELSRPLRDESGTLTIEFLIWLPLLCFWLVASVAFFQAYNSRNDSQNTAHVLSDSMSRQVEVTDGFLDDLYALQARLLPRAPEGTHLRVSSIQYLQIDDQYRVLWSRALGGGEPLPREEVTGAMLPMMADRDTVLLTELDVPFHPFTGWFGLYSRTWTFRLVSRPRFVSAVPLLDSDEDAGTAD